MNGPKMTDKVTGRLSGLMASGTDKLTGLVASGTDKVSGLVASGTDKVTGLVANAKASEVVSGLMTQLTNQPDDEWQRLIDAAIEAAGRAYAPYSHFPVGAAAYADDDRLVSGCTVENASIGLTLCAECGLISDFILSGGGALIKFVTVNGHGEVITPCGRCRQLLLEHGGPQMEIWTPRGAVPLATLMPFSWGPEQLEEAARRSAMGG